eukprot:1156828-Pelagomonas_calceolata.AAC.8
MPFLGETLLRPKLQQQVCGKPTGNIANNSGLLRGPLVLVGFPSYREVNKSMEVRPGLSGLAPIGHLRAHCLSWPTPGVVSINFDVAGCHAGRQERAAGLRARPE